VFFDGLIRRFLQLVWFCSLIPIPTAVAHSMVVYIPYHCACVFDDDDDDDV
jgi:hypothetical protein